MLSLKLSLQPKILWKNIGDSVYQSLKHKEFRLYQDSSGGKNWNHSIHIDKDRQSTVSFRGYQLKADNKIIESGNRVSPVLFFNNIASNLRVHIKQFWQNFPKAISANGKQINLEIFPETLKSDFELQGGEQKTHTIFLDFNSKDDLLEQMVTPLKVTLPLSHYADTSALPWLPSVLKSTELDKVILAGIEGEQNFFNKREKADEYGWRNFGELWADHETLEHGYDDKRVSHYNNQYDPVYGFFRQFILSGDQRFLELMDNLAKHVIDIDIYHTDKDRPEYNAGLFWHTDHYMDAGTCSHRTTSRQHMEADHVEQSGGGPSDEHCYTSGFMYHYFHTGHIKSKEAVVSLTHWIMRRIEGDRTVLDRLNSFFKQDLKAIKSLLSGEKILNYQYAFHRGTGNYINSLLDAYTVTDDPKYIEKVESVIKNTMSPQDDIQLRDLRDIELRWSYTVLLQSLCKYLSIRKNTPDKCFEFIRDCLLHYAWWMLENEKPYLETPELLVYPNDTWVAQDIRKAYIFYCAYQLTTDLNFLQASKDFFTYVNDNLNTKQVLKSSRILAILMQSHFHPDIQLKFPTMEKNEVINTGAKVNFSVSNILINFLLDVLKRLTNLSVRNEYQWFRQRFFNR